MKVTKRYSRFINKVTTILLFLLVFWGGGIAQSSFAPGVPAASLHGGVWLKGEPIQTFAKGNVYVLDFSSVLCSPCRAFIPHLTQLTHRYAGRVIVAGVYVYENPEDDTISTLYQEGVRRFISRMGSRIGYKVVVDGPTRQLAKAWMQAGGYEGLPTTFVVDQAGRMVWAGYPPGLESVLERVLSRTFSLSDGPDLDRRRISADTRIYMARKRKDYRAALAITDSLIREVPVDKHLYFEKFKTLLAANESEAYSFARWVAEGPCSDTEPVLFYIAREIVERDHAHSLHEPDYKLVIQLVDQALCLSRSDLISALLYDVKAQAYLLMGDKQRAIKAERKAIKAVPLDTYPTMSHLEDNFNARVQILQQQGRLR